MAHEYTNALINESSPYLLQHAHNPVNWEAWDTEVLQRADKENKLLIISIGYAACHWCHVMEEACFEDTEVAEVMNGAFINIKIDREERPDIDHIYMDALQMMTGSGGWPLNIVALPDGRPFWGATYVKKADWIRVLEQLRDLYEKDPGKIESYAQHLSDGLKSINLIPVPDADSGLLDIEQLRAICNDWSRLFDRKMGGYNRAPKFMMPVNLNFLLHYSHVLDDKASLDYVNTTLTKMAYGGIYDHIGGGFARYSVDSKWHVPHFEKMLYDNAQLISLYSKAYAASGNPLYKKVTMETIAFVTTELMDENFGFYSSLDADSNNSAGEFEEGAYYTWSKEELEQELGANFDLFRSYYNINNYGYWEKGNYVLIRDQTEKFIAEKHGISTERLHKKISDAKKILLKVREKRNKPRLDDKILTSWNGLMLSGLIDAYKYLNNEEYLDLALKNAAFIRKALITRDGGMYHNYKKGKRSIKGYLEDFAAVATAFLELYEVTADEAWLKASKDLVDHCIANYQDPQSRLFFFTSKQDDFVIRRTIETLDNVIPASNSIMALTLFRLSKLFPDSSYEDIARNMFRSMQKAIRENAGSHANWLNLGLFLNRPYYEIAVIGEKYPEYIRSLQQYYLPNTIIAATKDSSTLPIFQNRLVDGQTFIYVCQQGSCKLPVTTVAKVIQEIGQKTHSR